MEGIKILMLFFKSLFRCEVMGMIVENFILKKNIIDIYWQLAGGIYDWRAKLGLMFTKQIITVINI